METVGSSLYKKEKEYDDGITKRIPIGTKCYKAGDFADWTEQIVVTKENQKVVSMFWDSLYFGNEHDADIKTQRNHADYDNWLFEY